MNLEIKRKWIEMIGYGLASLILFQIGFMAFLFIVPLIILYYKKSINEYLIVGVCVGLMIIITTYIEYSKLEGIIFQLILIRLLIPTGLIYGIFLIIYPLEGFNRKLERSLISALVFGVISVPVILYLQSSVDLVNYVKEAVDTILNSLKTNVGATSIEFEVALNQLNADFIFEYGKQLILRSILFYYYALLLLSWKIGEWFGLRSLGKVQKTLKDFFVPKNYVWPIIISWFIIFIDMIRGLGFIGYVFWNIGLITLFLFGLQGCGIIQFLFNKYNLSKGSRTLIALSLGIMFIMPGIQYVIMIGIPGLGISEIWKQYRNNERSIENEDNT